MYTFKYNLTFEQPYKFPLNEYKITLSNVNKNNNSEKEFTFYSYMNKYEVIFSIMSKDRINLAEELNPDNINVINWLSKIHFIKPLNHLDIQNIFPGYNPKTFVYLFCRYLNITDKVLYDTLGLSKFDLLTVYLENGQFNDKIKNSYFKLIKNSLCKYFLSI